MNRNKPKTYLRKLAKILLIFFGIITGVIIVIFISFQISPRPGVILFSPAFNGKAEIKDEDKFASVSKNVLVQRDIEFDSNYKRNFLDIYLPKNVDSAVPIIFWVHGGGYIGGDKSSVEEFSTYIANENKVAVVSVNYELAPDLVYPGQLKQLDEAYNFLNQRKNEHSKLDFDRVLFGGDSAGAQIAAQYVLIQTNDNYAKEMSFGQNVKKNSIKGFISYCGPLDIQELANADSDNIIMKLFTDTIGWSLLGKKDWKGSHDIYQASISEHITSDFPPTYITDGNYFSFESQGIRFKNKLVALNVPVEFLFYENLDENVPHEYQFDYKNDKAKNCLNQTIKFINDRL